MVEPIAEVGGNIRMSGSNHRAGLADEPPESENITPYDRSHLATYLSLLYAAGEGQSDEEISRNILEIDAAYEPDRARKMLRSHLGRARWLAQSGYKLLLET